MCFIFRTRALEKIHIKLQFQCRTEEKKVFKDSVKQKFNNISVLSMVEKHSCKPARHTEMRNDPIILERTPMLIVLNPMSKGNSDIYPANKFVASNK